jgi:hypothetical protein
MTFLFKVTFPTLGTNTNYYASYLFLIQGKCEVNKNTGSYLFATTVEGMK